MLDMDTLIQSLWSGGEVEMRVSQAALGPELLCGGSHKNQNFWLFLKTLKI